jgi:nickel-dependent lactate racemase
MDQWQLEELAKILRKARVVAVTDGLPPETLRKLFVETAPTVEEAVADCLKRYGDDATIAVVPKGPYVIGQVASRTSA